MDNVTNFKTTFYLSLLVYLLVSVVGYQYLLKPIIEKRKENKFLLSQRLGIENVAEKIKKKKTRLNELDTSLFKFDQGKEVFTEVASFCKQHQLSIEYKEPTEELMDKFLISNNEITVQGGFKSIVQLVYFIEKELGWVDQCKFFTSENRNGRKSTEILQCEIHFKNMQSK